jgi:hypothetical protein
METLVSFVMTLLYVFFGVLVFNTFRYVSKYSLISSLILSIVIFCLFFVFIEYSTRDNWIAEYHWAFGGLAILLFTTFAAGSQIRKECNSWKDIHEQQSHRPDGSGKDETHV